jgi:hypothetical protein
MIVSSRWIFLLWVSTLDITCAASVRSCSGGIWSKSGKEVMEVDFTKAARLLQQKGNI